MSTTSSARTLGRRDQIPTDRRPTVVGRLVFTIVPAIVAAIACWRIQIHARAPHDGMSQAHRAAHTTLAARRVRPHRPPDLTKARHREQ